MNRTMGWEMKKIDMMANFIVTKIRIWKAYTSRLRISRIVFEWEAKRQGNQEKK